ncbi:YigZ family protein [Shewanella intestini]|uniref:YigZ family protein n=1 Tax=Shewanella intestini TaxID=2017544 RepID=A0ABS5I495_9GAMM|nr:MULTISPECIES: YigZ family protein [Shewanella]MBR9728847.1 YigZ family protein [Shewanella intestini]MRG37087.1 YigZ family protein [Shewanella sp. XMDDZSB0408]
MTEEFLIPAKNIELEEEIKHSRFISFMFHCPSADVMKAELGRIKLEFPGASHYCYAFVAGAPTNLIDMGSSDDGEPSGSAGRPMLACLQGANIGELGVIVVRYFGGTKLGVGGLVRAYSSGVKKLIPQLETCLKTLRYSANIVCDYGQLNDIEYVINQCEGIITDKQFSATVTVTFELAKAQQSKFNQLLATQTQGAMQVKFTA